MLFYKLQSQPGLHETLSQKEVGRKGEEEKGDRGREGMPRETTTSDKTHILKSYF